MLFNFKILYPLLKNVIHMWSFLGINNNNNNTLQEGSSNRILVLLIPFTLTLVKTAKVKVFLRHTLVYPPLPALYNSTTGL